jgi:hypothetical protein
MIRSSSIALASLPPPPVARSESVESGEDGLWRTADPIFAPDGLINTGGMFEHQRDLLQLDNFIKVLVMGYGGGKSLIIGKRAIAAAIHNAPVPAAVICPSYPAAKLTAIPTIKALLEGKRQLYGPGFVWRFVGQSPMYFSIRHKGRNATIYVLSSDRPDSLKGSNLCFVALEEPFIQPIIAFEQAIARVRDPSARHREILLAGTPEQMDWGYDLCEGELRERYDVGVITGSTMMNLALPKNYAETMMKGYDAKAAEAYVMGKFVNLSTGVVYYGFDQAEHVVAREPVSGCRLGMGMDFNVNPMACCVFWWKGNDIHILREYEFPNSDTEYACKSVREDWGSGLEDVFPDASGRARATNAPGGRSDFTILREQGFTVNAKSANPSLRDRHNAVNGKFKPAVGRHSITIAPECKRLIKYFGRYTHEDRNKEKMKAMSHLLDAATYPIAYLWPVARGTVAEVKYDGA